MRGCGGPARPSMRGSPGPPCGGTLPNDAGRRITVRRSGIDRVATGERFDVASVRGLSCAAGPSLRRLRRPLAPSGSCDLHQCTDAESRRKACHLLPQFEVRGCEPMRKASLRKSIRDQRIGAACGDLRRLKDRVAGVGPELPTSNSGVVQYLFARSSWARPALVSPLTARFR